MQTGLAFAHVAAVAIYIGATVLLVLLTHTLGTHAVDAVRRRERFAAVFRVYNPLAVAALGVVVMSGAFSLTPYKRELAGGYYGGLGAALTGKLGLAFLLIIMGTYICFGICHRMVRAQQGGLPVTDAELQSMVTRLRYAVWATVALSLYTLWVARAISMPSLAG